MPFRIKKEDVLTKLSGETVVNCGSEDRLEITKPTTLREQGTPNEKLLNHKKGNQKTRSHRKFFKRQAGKASLLLLYNFEGSVALEAAFVLPLALFFLLTLFSFFTMIGIQIRVQEAIERSLHYVELVSASQIASENIEDLVGTGIMEVVVRREMAGIDNVSLVSLIGTDIDREDDVVTLRVSYSVKAPTALFRVPSVRLSQSGTRRLWTGRPPYDDEGGDGDVVYITASGSVYHTHRDCTHLIQRTTAVSGDQLTNARAENGAIYYACHWCHPAAGLDTYYVTEYGNRYHSSTSCSQLRISVSEVPVNEIPEGMRCCMDCAAAG